MKSFLKTSIIIIAFVTANVFMKAALVESQLPPLPPCPPSPELASVVDTPEKCLCFYGIAGSGLDLGDASTFDAVFGEDSVQNFAQTGQYFGPDGIAEYLSFAKGGEDAFVNDYVLIGQPLFVDMTGTTSEQCVVTMVERRRLPFNPKFLLNTQELCIDLVAGSSLYYTMTQNPASPIHVKKVNIWLPDELVSGLVPYLLESSATAEIICDTIVNKCRGDNGGTRTLKGTKRTKTPKNAKATKNTKAPKPTDDMKSCLEKFDALPSIDSIGDYSYMDGDSKGCRVLHGFYARTNPAHCPHVSFEAEEDINGLVKCNKSKGTTPFDLFTPQQLGIFAYASTLLGLGDAPIDFNLDGCPAISV